MSEKAITVAAEETEKFVIDLTHENGNSVSITLVYPKGQAMSAISALAQVGAKAQNLMEPLRHDPSVQEFMKENSLGFIDDDDEF